MIKPCDKCGNAEPVRTAKGECKDCVRARGKAWYEANKVLKPRVCIMDKVCPTCHMAERYSNGTCRPCARANSKRQIGYAKDKADLLRSAALYLESEYLCPPR